ncbi:MAG TPA: fibro-slime domain-containing protein [Deltaproteobacteria bacterium]|nr:fibro-slime domain-containing protein [Deltaproteobacteria bacterium]
MTRYSRFLVLTVLIIFMGAVSAQAGLMGYYYNLDTSHPDVETDITGLKTGMVESSLTGPTPTLTAYGATLVNQFDWWDNSYSAFSRVDSDEDLKNNFASSWFPVNEGLPGDPLHFAVHWTGQFYVAADQNYNYTMGSDDDSWLFIDDQLVLDLGGIHAVTYTNYSLFLTEGWHDIDIFFAERHTSQSGFQLNFFSDLVPQAPEPSTLLLVGLGLLGLMGLRRK